MLVPAAFPPKTEPSEEKHGRRKADEERHRLGRQLAAIREDAGADEARGVEAVEEGSFGDIALEEGVIGEVEEREILQRRELLHRNIAGEGIEAEIERPNLRAVEDVIWETPLQRIVGEVDGDNGQGAEFPEEGEGEIERGDLGVVAEVDLGEGFDAVGVVGNVA